MCWCDFVRRRDECSSSKNCFVIVCDSRLNKLIDYFDCFCDWSRRSVQAALSRLWILSKNRPMAWHPKTTRLPLQLPIRQRQLLAKHQQRLHDSVTMPMTSRLHRSRRKCEEPIATRASRDRLFMHVLFRCLPMNTNVLLIIAEQ